MRRAAVVLTVLASAGGIAVYTGAAGAGAAPAPTISQVQAEVNSLQGKVDKIGQQFDAADQQLTAAKARLAQVTKQADRAQVQYNQASATLAALAVSAYENSGQTSVIGLLTSGDPGAVLNQASLLLQVEGTHNEQATQFLTTAQELASISEQRQRTEQGIGQIRAQLTAQKSSLNKLLATNQATLDSLTTAQQQQVNASTLGGTGQTSTGQTGTGQTGTTPVAYTGPTTTQADKAVAFAYAQIGKPYVWGGTGPNGYDCSGLVQAAWAAAGVAIPRTTYEDWDDLPHIPVSQMVPGDLIIYNAEGHVGMYVGDGYIIDAPHTGLDVERVPYDESWYIDNEDGVLQP